MRQQGDQRAARMPEQQDRGVFRDDRLCEMDKIVDVAV
jgi:hypothetical protein